MSVNAVSGAGSAPPVFPIPPVRGSQPGAQQEYGGGGRRNDHVEAAAQAARDEQARQATEQRRAAPPLKGLSVEDVRLILGAIPVRAAKARSFDTYA